MRTGMLRTGFGLLSVVLAVGTISAQDVGSPTPESSPPKPDTTLPKTAEPMDKQPSLLPENHADGHAVHEAEAHEIERGFFSGIDIFGDYLLLKPNRNAQDIAITAPNPASLPAGTVDNVNWGTRSGFDVGLGYRLPSDGWEICVNYMHISSADYKVFNAPSGGILLATMTAGGGNEFIDTAVGATSLQFHVIDLDVSKTCSVGDSFTLRFFAGARYAIIDQNLSSYYSGGALGQSTVEVDSPVNFSGGGLTAGAEGIWNVWHGLGLYGRGRLGMLAGTFNSNLTETTSGGQTVIVNVSDNHYDVVPVAELSAGLCWQSEHWHFKIGYEIVNWFNMVNSIDFPDGASIGHINRRTSDLSLDGLAVELGVVF